MVNNTFRDEIQMLIANQDYDIAENRIEKYKKIYGFNDQIANMEALIAIFKADYVKALDIIIKGLKVNIFNGSLYCIMGNIYEACGLYDKAYLCYEHSLYNENSEDDIKVIKENIERLKSSNLVSVKPYSIVLLTYNKLDYTKLCIDSIRKYNLENNYEIIVVDNNSTDGTREWLKEQEDIKCILNEENKGFPAGCNQGIEIAEEENDIFLLNNDTILMPNSIFNLRMGLYSGNKVGAAGAVSNSVSYYQQIAEKFNDFDGYMNYAFKNNISDFRRHEKRIKLIGFAMFIKREVLNKIGLLDERFTPGNYEDDDLSYRIIEAGYENLLCRDSYIHHFGSVSFQSGANDKYIKLLTTNRQKFSEKWGFDSNSSCYIRSEISSLISEEPNKKIKVLEVGCACGATLLDIKNKHENTELFGIELNENSAKIARQFADVRAEDIEKDCLSYDEKSFDYIIAADVLEHLVNPEKAINNLKKYLKDGGYILANIPNVMYFSVMRDMLCGKWTYQNQGILDKNHLRFFTKDEIVELFDRAGFSEINIYNKYFELKEEDKKFIMELNKLSDRDRLEEFATYEYIIKVK